MKKAWRLRTGTRVESLDDPVGEAPVGNVPLATLQERTLRALGFRVIDVDDVAEVRGRGLVLVDTLYVTLPLLRRFLRSARRRRGSAQLALAPGAFTRLTTFTGEQARDGEDVLYGLWWVRGPVVEARPLRLQVRSRDETVPFSRRIPSMADQEIPLTLEAVLEITSWVHLWQANLYELGARLVAPARGLRGWLRVACVALLGVLTSASLRPYAWATTALSWWVFRGRGCRIHPSAVVEASILGRNVEIGPNAVVRGCILGDDVVVQERAGVEGSILGDRVLINQDASIKAALAFPDAVFRFLQTGIVGRSTFLGLLCVPLDMKFEGTVRVRHRGALVDTGMPFLGCCIGHHALISGDTRVLPGRAIPNGCRILTDTGAIAEVPSDLDLSDFVVDRHGALGPLRPR